MAAGGSKYGFFSWLNFEELYNSYLGLEERQQLMAAGGALLILVLLIFMPITCASSKLSKLEAGFEKGRKSRDTFSQKIAEYQSLKDQLEVIRRNMGSNQSGSLNSLIESLANDAGIGSNIDRLKPVNLGSTDFYEEDGVDAAISNVNLEQLSQFLSKVEQNKSLPLHIKKLDIKTRYNKRDQFSVSMQIGTYRLKGEDGE